MLNSKKGNSGVTISPRRMAAAVAAVILFLVGGAGAAAILRLIFLKP